MVYRLWTALTHPFPFQQHIQCITKCSGTGYFTGVYKEDLICMRNGIETMRNDDAGSGFRQLV